MDEWEEDVPVKSGYNKENGWLDWVCEE